MYPFYLKRRKSLTSFENKVHRRLLDINYRKMKKNKYLNETLVKLIGKYEPLKPSKEGDITDTYVGIYKV